MNPVDMEVILGLDYSGEVLKSLNELFLYFSRY
jgi:hypothetical protein